MNTKWISFGQILLFKDSLSCLVTLGSSCESLNKRFWPRRLPRWLNGKEFACQCRRQRRCRFDSWVGKIPWRRKWQLAPIFFLENFMEPVGLKSMRWQRVGLDWVTKHTHMINLENKRFKYQFSKGVDSLEWSFILLYCKNWQFVIKLYFIEVKVSFSEV